MARRRKLRSFRASPESLGEVIRSLLAKMGGNPALARLGLLWTNWNEIVGELADMAQPVGKQGTTLFIGAENAMHMQELQFRSEEILEIVNNYLQMDYFDKIRFTIHESGKKCRPVYEGGKKRHSLPVIDSRTKRQANAGQSAEMQARKTNLTGKYLKMMDISSPVAKCYAAYVKSKI